MSQKYEFPQEITELLEYPSIENIPENHPMITSFDHVKWLEYFKAAEAEARAKNPKTMWKDPMMCALRRLAGRVTLDLTLKGSVTALVNGEHHCILAPMPPVGKTVRTNYVLPIKTSATNPNRPFASTLVRVVNMDSLSLTKQLIDRYGVDTVATINMANQYEAGGGWRRGKYAQEEMLFHRTTLSRSLESEKYPFEEFTCMLSRDVVVIREGQEGGFRLFEDESERWKYNVLTVAAFDLNNPEDRNLPPLEFTKEMEVKMRTKIRSMLALCVSEGIEVVVLSALGCGAFKNPPEKVSIAFKDVIEEFAGLFREIYFGILGAPDARNVVTFAKTLVDEKIDSIPEMKNIDELKELCKVYKCAPITDNDKGKCDEEKEKVNVKNDVNEKTINENGVEEEEEEKMLTD